MQEHMDEYLEYVAGNFLGEDDGAVAGPEAMHETLLHQLHEHGMDHSTELLIGEMNGKLMALIAVSRALFPEHPEVLEAVANAETYLWDGG
jgi:hypothetical protein